MALRLLKVAAEVPLLVIWMGRVAELARGTVAKSRKVGEKLRAEGAGGTMRLMNSSAVLESEEISRAEMRVPVVAG